MHEDEAAGGLDPNMIKTCSCRVQWDGGMRTNELGFLSGGQGAAEMAGAPFRRDWQ